MNNMLKYGILNAVLISVFLLYITQGFSLYGHWTDKILFWIWIGATIKILIQYRAKLIVKIYQWFLFICLILLCIPFFSPIVALISFSFGLERSFEKKIDENFRCQVVMLGLLGSPRFELIENKFPLEKVIASVHHEVITEGKYSLEDLKEIRVVEKQDLKTQIEIVWQDMTVKIWLNKEK